MTNRRRIFRAFAVFSQLGVANTHSRTHFFRAVAGLQILRSLHVQRELGRDFEQRAAGVDGGIYFSSLNRITNRQ